MAAAVMGAALPAQAEVKQCIADNNHAAEARGQGLLRGAREHYLACVAASDCPDVVREECQQALTELKTQIPSLLVAVVDEQKRDLGDATLTLDGDLVALDGSTLEVDPGSHKLVATRGELQSELQIVASESEQNRRVELVLAAPAQPVQAPPQPSVVSEPPPSRLPSYVLGGVALLGAGSFGYFALSGSADKSDLEDCKPYCAESDVQRTRTKYLIADVSLGVSLVTLGVATYLWIDGTPKERPQHARVALDVRGLPGGAALGVRWSE
jgi:hypothetical protein